MSFSLNFEAQFSAPARIRKGQGAEALNRALCVASRKLGYLHGVGMEEVDHPCRVGGASIFKKLPILHVS